MPSSVVGGLNPQMEITDRRMEAIAETKNQGWKSERRMELFAQGAAATSMGSLMTAMALGSVAAISAPAFLSFAAVGFASAGAILAAKMLGSNIGFKTDEKVREIRRSDTISEIDLAVGRTNPSEPKTKLGVVFGRLPDKQSVMGKLCSPPLPTNVNLNENEQEALNHIKNLRVNRSNSDRCMSFVEGIIKKENGLDRNADLGINWLKVAVAANDKKLVDSVWHNSDFSNEKKNDALGMARDMKSRGGDTLASAVIKGDIQAQQETKLARMDINGNAGNYEGIEKVGMFGLLKEKFKGVLSENSKVNAGMRAFKSGFQA